MQNESASNQNSEYLPDDISLSQFVNRLLEESSDEDKAAFLKALHERGETPEEVVELSRSLRERAKLERIPGMTDVVGTGGDGKNTINVSTAASFVASAAGIRVAKHGNFGATSNRGSADFLKHIGYNFEMTQSDLVKRLEETGFAFILAPRYNDNFAKFARARKMLPFKTVFNYLGPLTNPADPDRMVLGVTDRRISDLYSSYLRLNGKRGYVVYSEDGMDEVSPYSPSNVSMIGKGFEEHFTIDPMGILGERIGIEKISTDEPVKSFELTLAGLKGEKAEPSRFIALNAALPLMLNGKADSMEDAFSYAMELIKSGTAYQHLKEIVEASA